MNSDNRPPKKAISQVFYLHLEGNKEHLSDGYLTKIFNNNTFVFVNDLQGLLGTSVMICNDKVSFELF